jgi:cytochrome c oxidase subunit 3
MTVLLGVYFLSVQFMEYKTSFFTINSGSYGRIFFFGTGFHGLHVILGTLILLVRDLRKEL